MMLKLARLAVVVLGLAVGADLALAAQWGGIEPGESTMAVVRGFRGSPTRTATQKVDGYDTEEWIYEDAKAPAGIRRMTVDFGLMTRAGYRPDIVRTLKLEPKPGAFDKNWVTTGWGPPAGVGKDGDIEFFFYKEGLFVYFAPDGQAVVSMVFTPPQLPPGEAPPFDPGARASP
jgi:hypothetical protein